MTSTAEMNKTAPVVRDAELTHGTLESRELEPAREFYEKVLRLRCVRHGPVSELVAGCASFGMAAVKAGDKLSPQGNENRWVLSVGDKQDVAQIHADAKAGGYAAHVGDITEEDGVARFLLQDGDTNWWEVTSLPYNHYQALFERGDVA